MADSETKASSAPLLLLSVLVCEAVYSMPALYKFPPHPLCPDIQFKLCCEDDRPPWPSPQTAAQVPLHSARVERMCPVPLPMKLQDTCPSLPAMREDSSVPPNGPRAGNGHHSAGVDKPHKESRRDREAAAQRDLDSLELKIPYSMSIVPECTITSTGIHVSTMLSPGRSVLQQLFF